LEARLVDGFVGLIVPTRVGIFVQNFKSESGCCSQFPLPSSSVGACYWSGTVRNLNSFSFVLFPGLVFLLSGGVFNLKVV
jgi:hypothetical protein